MENRTDAQEEASRTNGAKGHGAVTPEGKVRSAQNSTKHGLYSTRIVLANESQQEFDNLYLSYCHEWNPAGPSEYDLVQDIAVSRWKINRFENMIAAAIDTDMFIHHESFNQCFQPSDPAMRHHDAACAVHVGVPGILGFYQRSVMQLHRLYTRSRNDLERLQTQRLGHPPVRNVMPFHPDPPPEPVLPQEDTQKSENEPEPAAVPSRSGKTYPEPETFVRFSKVDPTKLDVSKPPQPAKKEYSPKLDPCWDHLRV